MTVEKSWIIPTESLHVATELRFDIRDVNGQVIQRAGTLIDERLKDYLRNRGIRSFTLYEETQPDVEDSEFVLLSSFAAASISSIQASISATRKSLQSFLESLRNNDESHIADLKVKVREFVTQATNDFAATLAVIATQGQASASSIDARIANHSLRMALLSIVMSVLQRDNPIVSCDIGLAGLLHDNSQLRHPEWFSVRLDARNESLRQKYRRHSIESADLLKCIHGISTFVRTMITELHEQADGTGYPRGLPMERMMTGSLMLNLADAYFSLTDPIQGEPLVPSDALAYLCYHAAQGKFCVRAMQTLVECLSMYPIGSIMLLDDHSKVVTVKGNPSTPLQPIVRSLLPGHLTIDLRQSDRQIAGPLDGNGFRGSGRIRKSQMLEILWRRDR